MSGRSPALARSHECSYRAVSRNAGVFQFDQKAWWPIEVTTPSLLRLLCGSLATPLRPMQPLCASLAAPRTPCSPLTAPLQPSRDLLVGNPGVNSGKCTIIGGSRIKRHKLHRSETELTWAFTEDSFQVGTDSPKTPPKYRLRPPNIVDLPEFEGRFPTSTSYSSRFCTP